MWYDRFEDEDTSYMRMSGVRRCNELGDGSTSKTKDHFRTLDVRCGNELGDGATSKRKTK